MGREEAGVGVGVGGADSAAGPMLPCIFEVHRLDIFSTQVQIGVSSPRLVIPNDLQPATIFTKRTERRTESGIEAFVGSVWRICCKYVHLGGTHGGAMSHLSQAPKDT